MGHPRKLRKKYSRPSHPWQKERIVMEIDLTKQYGFKNKKEIWKVASFLSSVKSQAKKLAALSTTQSEKETQLLIKKLQNLGLLHDETSLDAVLSITLEDVTKRRLQSVLMEKGLARSAKQARQFITHKHVQVNGSIITSPAYMVNVVEESAITFSPKSDLNNAEHPERMTKEEWAKKQEKAKAESEDDKVEGKADKKEAPKKEEKAKPEEKAEKKEEKKAEKPAKEEKKDVPKEKPKTEEKA